MPLTLFNHQRFNYVCNVKNNYDKITNSFLCLWYVIFIEGDTGGIKWINFLIWCVFFICKSIGNYIIDIVTDGI